MTTLWIWLVVGLIPYYINTHYASNERRLQARALFWSLNIQDKLHGQTQWTLHIPLIKRLQHAVWAALQHPQGDDSLYE